MHYGKMRRGNYFPVRDYNKAGRHKRSSSKATAGISGKPFWGIHYQRATGKSGNHCGKIFLLAKQNYLPPPWCSNLGRSREGYGRYDFPVFSRIWGSTVELVTQSSILRSGGGGR